MFSTEWPGCPGRPGFEKKSFTQENFGLIFRSLQHVNFGHSHFSKTISPTQNGVPRMSVQGFSSQGFSVETLQSTELSGISQSVLISGLGGPHFQRFVGEMKLICYAGNSRERNSGNFFRCHGRKTQRTFGEQFSRFSPFNFQEMWPQEISRKILHIFHEGQNKILSR